MKTISAVLIFLISSMGMAADFGKPLSPRIDATGKASFGLSYVYDVDRSWSLLFTSNLSTSEINQLPQLLYWNIVDLKTNSAYQEWKQISRTDLTLATFEVTGVAPLFKFLPKMKDAAVVLSANKTNGIYYIDLKSLCESYPDNVRDMSNTMNPKCVVNSSQLPDLTAECKELTSEMSDYVKQGLLTCAIANKQLAKKGCAQLDCR